MKQTEFEILKETYKYPLESSGNIDSSIRSCVEKGWLKQASDRIIITELGRSAFLESLLKQSLR